MAGRIHPVLLGSPEGQESPSTSLGMAQGSLHTSNSLLQSWESTVESLLACAREHRTSLLLPVL